MSASSGRMPKWNQAAAADPALPVRWWRPLEGVAPKAHRGWAILYMWSTSGGNL